MATVFDIETDGLLDVMTKIHVLSWSNDMGEVKHTHDYDEMRYVLLNSETLVGHNIIRFDIPAVEKLLDIKVTARLVDTLALSWYLNHDRPKHGLEGYGVDYGVPKPVIDDWDSLTPEEYAHRCDEDVKINNRLWRDLDMKLNKLYQDPDDKWKLIDYLTFKLDCAREQEEMQWKLDVDKAQAAYEEITRLKEEKVDQLAEAMPRKVLTRVATPPKVMRKKDGELSSHGHKWVEICREHYQPITSTKIVVKTGEERGNPNSNDQVKDWLYGLGWKPRTWKFLRDKKTGDERKIEQVRKGSELCQSVRELSSVDAAVDLLDGLTVLTHRAGILRSFIECHKDGWLQASVAGLTNTFRFKHFRPLVNLPSVDKPYGDVIRGCLTCPDGYTLAGADMTSLEDTTKRHYMKPLDPDYVEEMSREGFDPHLDLAKHAGVITQDDIDKHNSGELSLKALRKNYKVVNYSATYGVGAAKLARETGMSQAEAKTLLNAFWSRNWSIEKMSGKVRTRELFGSMWLLNPVSGFWHSLRSDKDRFSTLNQSTGVYCFDTWVSICRKNGIKAVGQFHDEIIALVKKGEEGAVEKMMHDAAIELNDKVKLNVPLGTDVQFGNTYADIH
ncbi:DNA polymerase [bacterium]|nr:DNA polymerase [bacterium]MDB4352730.1 DNA polymerase [Porticoccaceae bacterium]